MTRDFPRPYVFNTHSFSFLCTSSACTFRAYSGGGTEEEEEARRVLLKVLLLVGGWWWWWWFWRTRQKWSAVLFAEELPLLKALRFKEKQHVPPLFCIIIAKAFFLSLSLSLLLYSLILSKALNRNTTNQPIGKNETKTTVRKREERRHHTQKSVFRVSYKP